MTFCEYVDDLAKKGIIDGHISEMLIAKHREEVTDPLKEVKTKVFPILEQMWASSDTEVNGYADRLDDTIEDLSGATRNQNVKNTHSEILRLASGIRELTGTSMARERGVSCEEVRNIAIRLETIADKMEVVDEG